MPAESDRGSRTIKERPPYTVALDATRQSLSIKLQGYWDVVIARAYVVELQRKVAQLDHSGAATYWLLDITEFAVQPSEVTEIVSKVVPQVITEDAIIAAASPNVLASMQAQRTSAGHKHRRFDNLVDAKAWLDKMREAKK